MFSILDITIKQLETLVGPILKLCSVVVPVMITVVGALGAIWCIVLGVNYSKAQDPQEHEKCKNNLKHAIIGFVLIFVLLIMLQIGVDIFTNWWSTYEY